MRPLLILCLGLPLAVAPAAAATLIADYSSLGNVYRDSSGNIYSVSGTGRVDVTSTFKDDINTAFAYLAGSVLVPWTETITFTLNNLGTGTVADAAVNHTDGNGRPDQATIRFNTNSSIAYYVDSTPWDNGEFTMNSDTASLGGGTVNNQRMGSATATGGAAGYWDLLTLAMHETEHAMGISSGLQRFLDLAGATGSANRKLTIPTTLSGLSSNFDIPITQNSAHYDGSNATFNLSVVSEPGWQSGQRALPTALDILGICQVEGCTTEQMNTDLVAPEPVSPFLLGGGLALLAWRRRSGSTLC